MYTPDLPTDNRNQIESMLPFFDFILMKWRDSSCANLNWTVTDNRCVHLIMKLRNFIKLSKLQKRSMNQSIINTHIYKSFRSQSSISSKRFCLSFLIGFIKCSRWNSPSICTVWQIREYLIYWCYPFYKSKSICHRDNWSPAVHQIKFFTQSLLINHSIENSNDVNFEFEKYCSTIKKVIEDKYESTEWCNDKEKSAFKYALDLLMRIEVVSHLCSKLLLCSYSWSICQVFRYNLLYCAKACMRNKNNDDSCKSNNSSVNSVTQHFSTQRNDSSPEQIIHEG